MNIETTPTRYAWLSIAAALATIALKSGAYFLSGSVGLLSDAMESIVNLVAAVMALLMLRLAALPPDEEHAYGHSKAEYFASGIEGALILIAALASAYAAIDRLLHPQELKQLDIGLAVSLTAALINLVVAQVLRRAGQRYRSVTLEADASHLMTDVWTSGGVLLGVGAVWLSGWASLDSIVALLVSANIIWMGVRLMRSSALGLMDTSITNEELTLVEGELETFRRQGIQFHALRTRQAGARRFMAVHVLVPGRWTVQYGHDRLEEIEEAIRTALPGTTIFTHLEPLEDPVSMDDIEIDRRGEKVAG
ncbi:MAG: cation diffusion facilitator family transporter [Caldilineaceae bacterium]